MKNLQLAKLSGFGLAELRGKVHVFSVGNTEHPEHEKVYKYLEELNVKLEEVCYLPNMALLLHDVDEEEKKMTLRA